MFSLRTFTALTLALLGTATAQAQVRLPDLPQVPGVGGVLNETVDRTNSTLGAVSLRDLRSVQIRDLIRRNREVLERGPNGEPIVRAELLAFDPTDAALERAQSAGFGIAREQRVEELGSRIVVLLAPPRTSTRRALRRLQTLDPEGSYDYNHVYVGSGAAATSGVAGGATTPVDLTNAVRIGLIDGGVQASHPSLATTRVHGHGCDNEPAPNAHGTAVASLIASQLQARSLELYSADVYCNEPTGGSVTRIVAAFGWMARQRVPVINVSLVGPANNLLERIVQTMVARGHVVVAAVGNDGPNAKPLYPAAYEGVIGVTGVDRRDRVIPEALRGRQVDFAAPGADITAATLDGKYGPVRGTSFAAPIVSALIARDCLDVRPEAAAALLERYAKVARDLGKPGLDPVYGHGLLKPDSIGFAQTME